MQKPAIRLAKYVLTMACALATGYPLTLWASGGTLTFVGAVVTPTCDFSATFGEGRVPTCQVHGISDTASTAPHTTMSSESSYSITKKALLATPSDQLLAYFYGYSMRLPGAVGQPPTEVTVVYR